MTSRCLNSKQAVLLVVDLQEKFLPVIYKHEQLLKNVRILIEMASQLNIPIIVSEQYPKGLGYTDPSLTNLLPEEVSVFEKTAFGCLKEASLSSKLQSLGRNQVILCGIETHVCISQTAHQLLDAGYEVHLIHDAVSSRSKKNYKIGLAKMTQSGVIPSSVELALFELMEDAKHMDFKALQSLVKE